MPASDPMPEKRAAIELTVMNHPGVMSHVCGLFARRAFNLEGIICMPLEGGSTSRILLLVDEDERFEQVLRQIAKLHDVVEARRGGDISRFERVRRMLTEPVGEIVAE